ncbi:hypothetical protein B484DRAFT_315215, partial [Ochromonadaceae sp. CCMP2298]
ERAALLDLFHATAGPKWTRRANWGTSKPLHRWEGVTVDRGRVVRLSLPRNNLSGAAPHSL